MSNRRRTSALKLSGSKMAKSTALKLSGSKMAKSTLGMPGPPQS